MTSSTLTEGYANHGGGRKEVTGRMVLVCLVTFFSVVIAVNAGMMVAAISTFAGLDSDSPYQEGLAFDQERSAAAVQQALHWQVEATLKEQAGATRLEITARDSEGRLVSGLAATATLVHPTDRHLDRDLVMTEAELGVFRGLSQGAIGQWDLVIELSRDGERVFRSKNRITLR